MTAPHYKPLRAMRLKAYANGAWAIYQNIPLKWTPNVLPTRSPVWAMKAQINKAIKLLTRETARPGCYISYGGERWHAERPTCWPRRKGADDA